MKVFWLDRKEALNILKKCARRLIRNHPEAIKVILFGSLAQNRAVPGSDADLLITLKYSEKRFMDRPLDFYKYFENIGIAVDVFCYTEEEIKEIPLAQNALKNGISLL
ncbi:MAG: nucleotidyltransferase domain-containing protein [Planctomycetota bacterium]